MQASFKIIFRTYGKSWKLDIMSYMNFLEKSFYSVCKAIQVLSTRCDNICVPLKHCFSYDLVVDVKGSLSRIKVLRTECKSSSGAYILNIRKSGRDGAKKEPFSPSMCDFVFAVSPEGAYLIPSIEITQKRAICLSMFEKYLIDTQKLSG